MRNTASQNKLAERGISLAIILRIKIQVHTTVSALKETCHSRSGHVHSGVYDAARIYSACLQFRARALPQPPLYVRGLYTYTRHVQSPGSWQLPVMGCSWHAVKQHS